MALSKLETKPRRRLKGSVHAWALALTLITFGSGLAHGQGFNPTDALRQDGAIAGLMATCDGDMSGWEKIEQFLASLPPEINNADVRSPMVEGYKKAYSEQVVVAGGQERKLPCDQLKSSGVLAKLKNNLITKMNDLIKVRSN